MYFIDDRIDMTRSKQLAEADSTTDLYKVPDAVPPIHTESYHVATDRGPSIDGSKFWSILATIYNQSQLAERKHVESTIGR